MFGYPVGPHSWKQFLLPSKVRLLQARRTPEQWAKLAPFVPTRADDIRRTLTHIDQHWGHLDAYLNAHGLPNADLTALRDRLNRT